MLGSDELRAWYGPDHVELAIDRGAVGTLLISDELFRYGTPDFSPIRCRTNDLDRCTDPTILCSAGDMSKWWRRCVPRVEKL